MAFLDKDGVHWDYAETYNHGLDSWWDDPWEDQREREEKRRTVTDIWNGFEDEEKGWIEVKLVLPYDSILDIDDDGDDVSELTHVYVVPHMDLEALYSDHVYLELTGISGGREIDPDRGNRVEKFPRRPN